MKRFIRYILLFGVILTIILFVICYVVDAIGWSDFAYKRLRRSHNERSLILGVSRSAQGICPDVINKELEGYGYSLPIYNFSFTIDGSPYGETYYEAIKRKLIETDYGNGLFILEVSPWNLSVLSKDNPTYPEEYNYLTHVHFYTKPNYEYLFKEAVRPFSFGNKVMVLQDDGRLVLNVPMDSSSIAQRSERRKKDDEGVWLWKSEYRMKWLVNTIKLLKTKGSVFLVYMPSSEYFINKEKKCWPQFKDDIIKIAADEKVEFISFDNVADKYRTIDGMHLYKDDAIVFTKDLCDSIKIRKHSFESDEE